MPLRYSCEKNLMDFGRLLCMFNAHRPLRRTVTWDGRSYVGDCKWCGKPIWRKRKGAWRRIKPAP